jgi:tetratricopeptide (TPR) repeat protein
VAEVSPAERVVALLEWGDVGEADAAIAEARPGWEPLVWRGARALMEGRFLVCEGLVAAAADQAGEAGELPVAVLTAALRREQERPAEAEAVLRSALEGPQVAPTGPWALLALVVGEMGRDGQARTDLARLLPREPVVAAGHIAALVLLAELAASVEAPTDDLAVLSRRLLPHASDFAVEAGGAAIYGSVALALGRLAHAGGAWEDAIAHYKEAEQAHRRVGAPLLLAHTQRHRASLLRTRGAEGDWDQAVALLREAASIYARLGVDQLAAKTQAVLARAEDGLAAGGGDQDGHGGPVPPILPAGTLFRRDGAGWLVGSPDDPAILPDAPGLGDIARLLGAPGVGVHVTELQSPGPVDLVARREYEARVGELAGDLVEAERSGDRVAAALLRAERDVLAAALDGGAAADPLDLLRLTVAARVRLALDRIERARPAVGRHLRQSVRTGTICAYAPEGRSRWAL